MSGDVELKQGRHTLLSIKVALVLMILGFAIALACAVVTTCLNAKLPGQREVLKVLSHYVIWFWPSAIMMTVADSSHSNDFMAIIILLISAITNGCLYGLVGLAIGTLWERLRRDSRSKRY